MSKKIGRNELCPCGSGKKYKYCCGARKETATNSIVRSDKELTEFVLEKLSEDINFLANTMQWIIGPYGFQYCNDHLEELKSSYERDQLKTYVQEDRFGLYSMISKEKFIDVRKIRPYGSAKPEKQTDIMSLFREGKICVEGHQIELFHEYIINHLSKRFADYLYVPSDLAMDGQTFGAFARRGYDFLLVITLYLELQLGVHVYLNYIDSKELTENVKKIYSVYLSIEEMPETELLNVGLCQMLKRYIETIGDISANYKAEDDLSLYYSIGAFDKKQYEERRKLINADDVNYIAYLLCLVSATCFNKSIFYDRATFLFPECDVVKYLSGLEAIIKVYEDKKENEIINPREIFEEEFVKENDLKETKLERRDIYHTAVFLFMDEKFGMSNGTKPHDLVYEDVDDINGDDYDEGGVPRNNNPAIKSTRITKKKKLRMEIYNALNGKSFVLRYFKDNKEDIEHPIVVAQYPILPWLSSGKENTLHIRPFDWTPRDFKDLLEEDTYRRQEFLTMEYRLTTIPVNCIEEYLNPDIFYSWDERNRLLILMQKQNESLIKQMQLNQELVRSLSHSAANYLDSEKLTQTGLELQKAEINKPTLDQLHIDGLSLILQSEQEMFLARQLNSLVWRCSADVESLIQQIRGGLSKEEGLSILEPVEFAIKTVIARVLFRNDDRRGEFIRSKLKKSKEEIIEMQSSFMTDVLAVGDIKKTTLKWWNKYVGVFEINISPVWDTLKVIKGKAFYDLVTEIVTEQILNALSHGDVEKGVELFLGQADESRGRPRWTYIKCRNERGKEYNGGKQVGISSLNETITMLNSNKRGIEIDCSEEVFINTTWLIANLVRPLRKEV